MKKILLFLAMIALYSNDSASQGIQNALNTVKAASSKPIYISTFTSFKKADGEMGMKTEILKLNTAYFEINLMSFADGKYYRATKDLEPLTSLETLHSISIGITDEKSEHVNFNNSTDFLNYMDARGYEMKDQKKLRFGTSYTFKKK